MRTVINLIQSSYFNRGIVSLNRLSIFLTTTLMLSLFAATTNAATYGGGSGTIEDPHQIWTAEQMNTIGANPDDWDKHFMLMTDIDMSAYTGTQFNQIGTEGSHFTGVFDGKGHRILNLKIETNGRAYFIGLFTSLGGSGRIQNLGLEDVAIIGGDSSYVLGTLCAGQYEGTISNCFATGTISAGNQSSYLGGLCGATSWNPDAEIVNCYSNVRITGGDGSAYIGGLSGFYYGQIINCYAIGNITAGNSSSYLGGLSGIYGTSTNSFWDTQTTGMETSYAGTGKTTAEMKTKSTFTSAGWDFVDIWTINEDVGYPRLSWETPVVFVTISGHVKTPAEEPVEGATLTFSNGGGSATTGADGSYGRKVASGWSGTVTPSKEKLSFNPVYREYFDVITDQTDQDYSGYVAPRYGGGYGTLEDPYQVWTAEQMNTIGANPDDWDKHFKLMANIDMSAYTGSQYNIIGTGFWDNPFTGTFDGNGHVISNLTYTTTAAVDYVGLFGSTLNATIQNLGIENVSFSSDGDYIGGLVGYNGGSLNACYVTGSVSGTGESSSIGGIVGWNNSGSLLTGCHATGSVSGMGESSTLGGLVGTNYGGSLTACYATDSVTGASNVGGLVGSGGSMLIACYATGSVSGTDNVGGLVGNYWGGTLTSCYATGSVSGKDYVGGLLGSGNGMLTACYATGLVSGTDNVGGLVGQLLEGQDGGLVINCYALGNVGGSMYIGGLVGSSWWENISNCYATGNVVGGDDLGYVGGFIGYIQSSVITDSYALGAVSAANRVGGLIGYAQYNTCMISRCFASGTVSGTTRVGGLVGVNDEGNIENCYATGRATATGMYVGGLVGRNFGPIQISYSVGSVNGTNSFIGGLVGESSDVAQVTGAFWDMESSGQATSSGGTGKTTAEMQTLSTFINANWDFVGELANGSEDVWKMPKKGYPILSWQTEEIIVNPELIFNLSPSHMSGLQWTRTTFRGELINAGPERVYINGVSFTGLAAAVMINNDVWIENGPAFLDPNESWTGDLFDVYMDIATPLGDHFGTLTILGGVNETSGDALATQNFQVTIQPILDYNQNGVIDLPDLALFVESWLTSPCNEANSWCNDRDMDHLGSVDLEDFVLLAQGWLMN